MVSDKGACVIQCSDASRAVEKSSAWRQAPLVSHVASVTHRSARDHSIYIAEKERQSQVGTNQAQNEPLMKQSTVQSTHNYHPSTTTIAQSDHRRSSSRHGNRNGTPIMMVTRKPKSVMHSDGQANNHVTEIFDDSDDDMMSIDPDSIARSTRMPGLGEKASQSDTTHSRQLEKEKELGDLLQRQMDIWRDIINIIEGGSNSPSKTLCEELRKVKAEIEAVRSRVGSSQKVL